MDPHLLWTDVIVNQVETQNLAGSPVFASDANVPYIDLSGEDSADMSIWNSGGPSSSRTSRHSLDQGAHEHNKMEHGWASSLTINGGQGSRTEERQLETTNMLLGSRMEGRGEATNILPVENRNLDLNSNQVDVGQSFSQSPGFIRNSDYNTTHAGRSSLVLEAGQFSVPSILGSSGSGQVPSSGGSSSLSGSSSRGAGFLPERGECIPGNSFDGRRLSCKRKSIEGVSAQCSASGSPSCIYQGESGMVHSVSARQSANTTLSISSSSNYPSGASSPGEQLNPRIGTTLNVGTSDCHSHNVTGSTERSQRNCRIRINNPAQLAAPLPNQWSPGNSLRSSDLWPTHQETNSFVPFNQSFNSMVAVAGGNLDGQSPVLPVSSLAPNTHPFPVHVAPSSRTGNSSRSPANAAQRSSASREEANSRSSLPRNNILETSVPVPIADIGHLIQHSSSWSLAPTSQSGTSSRVVQSSGPTWTPHQNPPSQYQRRLSVVSRRSVIPAIPSGSGRSISVPPLPPGPSNTLQQELNTRAAVLRSLQHMRSANGVLSDPTSLRALAMRESRSRVLTEVSIVCFVT